MKKRASGVLLHITSLPSPYGVGSLGQAAKDFIDFLEETGQTYWQILPLTTTSYGDSPYQSFSAVAGNTHLIDLDRLVERGWLQSSDLVGIDFGSDPGRVDYERLFYQRRPILEKAVAGFFEDSSQQVAYGTFEQENQDWLFDYAEFMALKEHFGQVALQDWSDRSAILRDENSLNHYRQLLAREIAYHKVTQFFFFSQWQAIKSYANTRGIEIIGDMPIYVSADSVEVWIQPELFKLSEERRPQAVAGCPPDAFSEDGQLWGNPIYDWSYHRETGFAWWIYRIKQSFKLYDHLRIDHFRGFSDYWEIDGQAATAKEGSWQPGPGYDLFARIREELGDLSIIAEDLGEIDDKAQQLLQACGYPGMKVLQFAFGQAGDGNPYLPHNHIKNSISYIGTHDNDVATGWYDKLDEEVATYVSTYLHRGEVEPIHQALLRSLFGTVSDTVIVAMQDLLGLPASSRMNVPSTVGGNWEWRLLPDQISQEHKDFLKELTRLYGR